MSVQNILYLYGQIKGGDAVSPKGRTTKNPKKGRLEIRTSAEEEQMLDFCCEQTGKTRTDIVRAGIRKIYDELKK